jgi:hypothetical protein
MAEKPLRLGVKYFRATGDGTFVSIIKTGYKLKFRYRTSQIFLPVAI